MKIKYSITFFILMLFISFKIQAQFGNTNNRFGRNAGGSIPQAQDTPKEEEPKTAAQIVDAQMPSLVASLELDPFQEAVLSTTLKKYMQERIELQILKLPNDKMREAYKKINEKQDQELKAGLPTEKYNAFIALQKNGLSKAKKDLKKKERKRKKLDDK